MSGKIQLYFHTIRYLKPRQVFHRLGRYLGIQSTLRGMRVSSMETCIPLRALEALDYDPIFLHRFSVPDLMADRVSFLHEEEHMDWNSAWRKETRSPLWNFNLHYFEFLHPLTKQYLETGSACYLEKTVQMIRGWILQNPKEQAGDGWSSYAISLRLTNWLAYLSAVGQQLDADFRRELTASIHEQYAWLSTHLEMDILGNHYFENLKALVLCALFFHDTSALSAALPAFRAECQEEILPDGMHFELSPMYHKIVLEGLLRVCAALRAADQPDGQLEALAQSMLDAAYAMENGLSRTPLFNDSGDNTAKSLQALLTCAEQQLGLRPTKKASLPDSGYYFFENGPWRLIVDAGAPGPDYIPGHSHCDAMSFELFRSGEPVLVNSGTYAYQCPQRHWFRSTEAHNTVQISGVEQSQIWGTFRLAKRSRTRVLDLNAERIRMELTDYRGNRICRELRLTSDALYLTDQAPGKPLCSHLHTRIPMEIRSNAAITRKQSPYAPEYGLQLTADHITVSGTGTLDIQIPLP